MCCCECDLVAKFSDHVKEFVDGRLLLMSLLLLLLLLRLLLLRLLLWILSGSGWLIGISYHVVSFIGLVGVRNDGRGRCCHGIGESRRTAWKSVKGLRMYCVESIKTSDRREVSRIIYAFSFGERERDSPNS